MSCPGLVVIPARFLAGIQGWPEWMPVKFTLASHSSRLKNQTRAGMLRKGRRGHDDQVVGAGLFLCTQYRGD